MQYGVFINLSCAPYHPPCSKNNNPLPTTNRRLKMAYAPEGFVLPFFFIREVKKAESTSF